MRLSRIWVILPSFLIALVVSADPVRVREQIEVLLSQRHPKDTAATWRDLGPETPAVILTLLKDEKGTARRMRLLEALGWFDTPEAVGALKQEALESGQSLLKRAAIRSIGYGQGEKEAEFLVGFLESEDAEVRYAAVNSLKRIQSNAGEADRHRIGQVVDAYLAREKTPWIADKLKGTVPQSAEPLVTSISKLDDRLDPALVGQWKGLWIESSTSKASELSPTMVSFEANLDLKAGDAETQINGSVTIKRSGETQLEFHRAKGKGSHFAGTWNRKSPAVLIEFVADLHETSDSHILELRMPRTGTFLLVRKARVKSLSNK